MFRTMISGLLAMKVPSMLLQSVQQLQICNRRSRRPDLSWNMQPFLSFSCALLTDELRPMRLNKRNNIDSMWWKDCWYYWNVKPCCRPFANVFNWLYSSSMLRKVLTIPYVGILKNWTDTRTTLQGPNKLLQNPNAILMTTKHQTWSPGCIVVVKKISKWFQ